MMRIAALMRPEGTEMTCKYCGIHISRAGSIYVGTIDRGDACCGDVFTELNTDGQHEPKELVGGN